MKKLLALLCLVTVGCAAGAAAASPPAVDAKAWIVEYGNGQVLASHDADTQRAIASITKLMTVIVTLEHHKLTDVITVDPRAAAVGQESIDLRSGEQMTVANLVRGALIQSANDAAAALALGTSPSFLSFANLMNAKAAQLGLEHTHFVTPDGLDAPGEYSTAADVTTLARDAMQVPFVRQTVGESVAYISGARTLHTWNDLLGVLPGDIGVKTGHTDNAGWCQVLADRQGSTTLYVTILGSPTRQQRNRDLARLASWGLGVFTIVQPVDAHRAYATVELPYGRAPLPLVAGSRLRTYIRPGRALTEKIVAPRSTRLPVRRGQVLGHIEVWVGNTLLGRRPLVASRSVAKPGLGGRVTYYAGRTVHHIERWLT
ncbi:MAG TPA: D-alanyl-D-alanine carboxypeptidase family protein [Gaiellaceae bacterium]|jgi:D-alanyl-D-alanine carboxypeptidase (penicillin-binding protein 5/6)